MTRCPLTDEWVKTFRYTQTMEYYLTIKGNKFESVEMRWINLVTYSEVSQEKKISRQCIYTESRKMVLMNLFAWQEERHR